MGTLKMPTLAISFTSAAQSAARRATEGVLCVLVRDATAIGGKTYTISSARSIPTALSSTNQAFLQRAFLGNVNPPARVLCYVVDDGETNTLTAGLAWAATQSFDWLCGPADVSQTECASIAAWIKQQREESGAKYKAVLPGYAGDSEAIVNFATETVTTEAGALTAAQYCSRIAGLLCGTPATISATYAALPDATDCTRLTPAERDTAVGAGKLICWYDGTQVLLGRAVNSLQTLSEDQNDSWKKIKIVSIMDTIRADWRSLINTQYVGKFANTYDNKMVLVAALRDYLDTIDSDGSETLVADSWTVDIDVDAQEAWLKAHGTETSGMTEQEIREALTGSEVFMAASIQILDAIEDVTISVAI